MTGQSKCRLLQLCWVQAQSHLINYDPTPTSILVNSKLSPDSQGDSPARAPHSAKATAEDDGNNNVSLKGTGDSRVVAAKGRGGSHRSRSTPTEHTKPALRSRHAS